MYRKQVEMLHKNGLHLRPTAQFVMEASKFNAEVVVTVNGKSATAKSLIKLQMLEVVQGTMMTISAEGLEEQVAVDHLVTFIQKLS
jgi:phosphocarrier protein HPr